MSTQPYRHVHCAVHCIQYSVLVTMAVSASANCHSIAEVLLPPSLLLTPLPTIPEVPAPCLQVTEHRN